MGGLGASYFKGSDDDTANDWIKIAALSNQVGENAEKADTATAYESLVGGKGIPEGMSDTVKINAKKMLADNMQGETVAAEQQIMADIASKAKEQGVGIHDYLKGNVESYLTTPASYRAVGNISKMFQERQFADASYQKAKMEEGELRYKEVSSLVQAADGLYKKGDLDGSKKMIEQISRIIPIPGFAKANEETGELEGYTTDFDKGGHKPAGMKFDVGGFINAAKKVTREEFAYGFALNSQVVNEMVANNIANASIMKDKNGGRYMGFNVVNPYDATDTKYIVKQAGSGKTIAQFESIHEAVDSGYTPYNQKYEEGERKIKYMDEDQSMQRSEHGARMQGMSAELMLKRLGIHDKKADMEYEGEIRPWNIRKAKNEAIESEARAKGETVKEYNKNLNDTFKALEEFGVSATPEVSGLVRELPKNMTSTEKAQYTKLIADKTSPIENPAEKKRAIEEMVASAHGIPSQVYSLRKQYPDAKPEELAALIQEKEAEAIKMKAEEQKATEQKKAESVFEGIRQKYKALEEEAKNRVPAVMSSSLMPPSAREMSANLPVDKTELLLKAMKEPLFGEGLYDIKSKYYPKTTDEEFINILMDYMSKADTAEMQKRQAMAQAGKADEEAIKNKKTFYRFEGLRR